MDVDVIDVKTGMLRKMPERFAKVLVKLKRVRWPEPTHTEFAFPGTDDSRTIYDVDAEMKAANAALNPVVTQPPEIKVSKAAKALAESSGIDILKVIGTGQDGAVTKPDVQAFIDAKAKE